jgi:hypothetical protein
VGVPDRFRKPQSHFPIPFPALAALPQHSKSTLHTTTYAISLRLSMVASVSRSRHPPAHHCLRTPLSPLHLPPTPPPPPHPPGASLAVNNKHQTSTPFRQPWFQSQSAVNSTKYPHTATHCNPTMRNSTPCRCGSALLRVIQCLTYKCTLAFSLHVASRYSRYFFASSDVSSCSASARSFSPTIVFNCTTDACILHHARVQHISRSPRSRPSTPRTQTAVCAFASHQSEGMLREWESRLHRRGSGWPPDRHHLAHRRDHHRPPGHHHDHHHGSHLLTKAAHEIALHGHSHTNKRYGPLCLHTQCPAQLAIANHVPSTARKCKPHVYAARAGK